MDYRRSLMSDLPTVGNTSVGASDGGGDAQPPLHDDNGDTNEMPVDNLDYEYTPKNIGPNNVNALQSEFDRMKAFMRKHNKNLEDMDDSFISDFQATKKNLLQSQKNLDSYFGGLKDYGCDDAVIKTMRQLCATNDPLKEESKRQFVTYANANMTQKLESESAITKLSNEKRKLEEDKEKLNKELEAVKKLKMTTGREANYSATTTTSTNVNYNGRPPETGFEYSNKALSEKFKSSNDPITQANVREVYLNSNAQEIFDMVRANKNNQVRGM